MLSSLEFQNYRRFRQYKLSGLSRVNLIVGKNNSGKTSILEAVHLLSSGGDYGVLAAIAQQRSEVISYLNEEGDVTSYSDISHFFHGHQFEADSQFTLRAEPDQTSIQLRPTLQIDTGPDAYKIIRNPAVVSDLWLTCNLMSKKLPPYVSLPPIPVSDEGAISMRDALRYVRIARGKSADDTVCFVSPDSIHRPKMRSMWDKLVLDGRDAEVVKALGILAPELESIVFLGDASRAGIYLGFEGSLRRLPLGSYGEGMRRMLALGLALATSRNGTLLIDEIDTGLHYSIMGDMWLLVAETARRYNIQVFATTHSFDCIRGLDWLCRHHPELADEVSLQKIEPDLEEAVALDATQIKIAVEQDIEVR